MIYVYRCYHCEIFHEVSQAMEDKHEYFCPTCREKCSRVYQLSQVKKNEGFFSVTLGQWVDSHNDFENRLRRTRYITGEAERLNDNSKPKDEWIEKRYKEEVRKKELIKQEQVKADMVYYNAQKD